MDNETIGYIVLFVFWLLSQLASAAKKGSKGPAKNRTRTRAPEPASTQTHPQSQPSAPPPLPPPEVPSRRDGLEQEAQHTLDGLKQALSELAGSGDGDERVQGQVRFVLDHGARNEATQAAEALESAMAGRDTSALPEAMERARSVTSFLDDVAATAKTHAALRRRPETRRAREVADRLLDAFQQEFGPFAVNARIDLSEAPPVVLIWDLARDDRLSSSPMAGSTLFVPLSVSGDVLQWSAAAYELARYLGDACPDLYREVYERLSLQVTDANVVNNPEALSRLLFASYIVRVLADATGASLYGPAYLRAITRLLARPQAPAQVTTARLNPDGTVNPEPPAHLRIQWTAAWVSHMGFQDEARDSVAAWTEQHQAPETLSFFGTMGGIPLEPIVGALDALMQALFRLELQALGGRRLAEVPGVSDWAAHARAAKSGKPLLASGKSADGSARALIASAMEATLEKPENAKTIRSALYQSLGTTPARPAVSASRPVKGKGATSAVAAASASAPAFRPKAHAIAEALILGEVLLSRSTGGPHRR